MNACFAVLGLSCIIAASGGAQTIAVSNLNQPTVQSLRAGVSNTLVYAQGFSFTTGATTTILTRLTFSFASSGPGAEGFSANLYSGFSVDTGPTGYVCALFGPSAPQTAGTYSYSPSTSLTLNSNSIYWIGVSEYSATATVPFFLNATSSFDEDPATLAGWNIGNTRFEGVMNDGGRWNEYSGLIPQISLEVAAIPEPSSVALGTGCAVFCALVVARMIFPTNARRTK